MNLTLFGSMVCRRTITRGIMITYLIEYLEQEMGHFLEKEE